MTVLENILSQEIIQRLGWTLLHFVWQAAVIALLLAILLRLLRKSAANLRYIIAFLALVLIVLLPVITIQLVPVSVTQVATYIEPAPAPAVLATEEIPIAETIVLEEPEQLESVALISVDSWKQRTIETLEPALPYIVSGWLVGVFGLSIWHLGGWAQLQRLRRRMVKQVNDNLHSKLNVLAERLRVKQTVQLMESALIQIPTVVGWLRPVILLPASALTGLTSEQLEAILAHELAHIKRVDYLVNILQTVVEILGFYHPAVWWVSHKIRAERENCCDDLAVSISGDRVCYARALTSMEEIRAGRGELAVAATGGNLFRRIYRLVGKDSAQKTPSSWIPAATAILLIIALAIPTTLALTTQSDTQKNGQETDAQVDEEPPAVEVIAANENLEILGIEFEPIHQGKNEVNIKVRNKTEKEQIFGTNIITLSPDEYGKHGIGWGSLGSFEFIQPQNTETVRFVYKIERPVNDNTWVWLILYNPLTQENLEQEHFFEKRFYSSDLEHSSTEILDAVPVSQNQTSAVHEAFRKIQDNIRNQEYEKVWELCTEDYKIAEFHGANDDGFGIFKDTMEQTESGAYWIVFIWDKREFLDSQPEKVSYHDGIFYLAANYNEQHWLIHFKMEDSQYKIDWIDGFTPRFLKEEIERQRVLSAENLKQLGLAVAMYADDHDKKLPDTLEPLKPYIANEQDYQWTLNNVEYLGKDKIYLPNQARIPVAYDKTLKEEQSGTNVLFLDGHVEFLTPARLKEFVEAEKRVESAKKLSNLGHALLLYANDHDDKYPDSLQELQEYLNEEEFEWTLANVEYLAKGKTIVVRPDTVVAYDKTLLTEGKGTNVLFNDSNVEFVKPERLKELGISATVILIETRILSVSEDFLKDIGLDANSVSSSDAWSEHLVADSAAEPNSETYSLILDELHIRFLLKAVGTDKGAKMLAAPRVTVLEGKEARITTQSAIHYISGYAEPNRPSDEPVPKLDKVELGTRIWLKPELTPDNKNIKLDFKMEIRQFLGYEERKYKGKYPYKIPKVDVISTKMPCLIPDGKTLLITGLKKIEQVESRSGAPRLSDLPLIGVVFSRSSKTRDNKMLLILVKPTINPQQKASKILPGEADSEEHIKHLGRLLEKKLNPPAEPK